MSKSDLSKDENELTDLLTVDAAFGKDGVFVGLRLVAKNKPKESMLLYSGDDSLPGFRVGKMFVPGMFENIVYKPVSMEIEND